MITESWGVALVVLAAVLVGATIPALVQLRATLRELEAALRRSGAHVDQALRATVSAAERIDALVVRLEAGGRVEKLADGAVAVGQVVEQLRDTVRIASAVGAALGAAARSFRGGGEAAPPPPHSNGLHPEPERQDPS